MSRQYWPLAVIAICSFIWGSTWLALKYGLDELPPFWFAGLRFTLATVLLFALMIVRKIAFPKDRYSWKTMAVIGFYQGLDYLFIFWGEQYIGAGIGAILFATMPFFVLICSYFMIDDHAITTAKLTGIIVSFSGVVLIFSKDLASLGVTLLGDLAIIGGAVCGAYLSVYAKRHAQNIHPVANTTVQMALCAVMALTLSFFTETRHTLTMGQNAAISVLYLGIVGSAVAFVLYMWVIKKVSVVEASIIPVATTIVAVFLGWLWRNEELGWNVLFGTILIFAGIYLVNIYQPAVKAAVTTE